MRQLAVLRDANPVKVRALAGDVLSSELDALGRVIVDQPASTDRGYLSSTKRRSRTLRRSVAIGAISVAVATGAAAVGIVKVETGDYAPANRVQAGGPGEYLRVWAPGFCRYVLSLSSSIPYPPGYSSWRTYVPAFENEISPVSLHGACPTASNVRRHHLNRVEVSTGAERGSFAMSAFCAWVTDWSVARKEGNSARASIAARVILGATKWPAVVAEDRHPRYVSKVDHSVFGFFLRYQNAVRLGETSRVSAMVVTPSQFCAGFRPPPGSHGGTVNPALASIR